MESTKVYCPECRRFAGFACGTSGPQLDGCMQDNKGDCKFSTAMNKKYDPVMRPTCLGSRHASPDGGEDSGHGTYYTHGMTAEDQG